MHPLANQEPPVLGQHDGFDIYPMPVFARIAVADVTEAAAWYERALGFAAMFRMPGLVHLRRKRYQDVLIVGGGPAAGAGTPSSWFALCFEADGELDAIAAGARAAGVAVDGPVDTPWNAREVRVVDPFGYKIIFTGRAAEVDPEAMARWKARFAGEAG